MRAPRMSIIMSTHNGFSRGPMPGRWLERAVLSALEQDYHDTELIVYDDGSTDSTFERLSEMARLDYRMRIVPGPSCQGIAHGYNTAAEFASGEWLFPMGDDDEVSPQLITATLRHLELSKTLGIPLSLCGQWMATIDADGVVQNEHAGGVIDPDMIRVGLSGFGNSSGYFGVFASSREAWDALGGYDAQWKYASDLDYALRAIEKKFLLGCVPRVLYNYRTTGAGNIWNISTQFPEEHKTENNAVLCAHWKRMENMNRRMTAPRKGLLNEYRA